MGPLLRGFQQRFQIPEVFSKGHHKAVRGSLRQSLLEQAEAFVLSAQPGIGCRHLDPQMQGHKVIVKGLAHGQQSRAAAQHPGPFSLCQIHLIFDQPDHGLAGSKGVHGIHAVGGVHLRNAARLPPQGVIIGADGVEQIAPCHIVLPEHLFPPYFQRDPGRVWPAEGQPPRQKITAEGHVGLTIALDLCIGTLQQDLCIVKTPLLQIRFCPHDGFRPHAVPVGDLIIVGHTLIHLRQLPVQLTGLTVEHHQHRGRAEGPSAAVLDADCRVGHLCTGAAVQAAHGRDIIVHKKAQDQVALSQKTAFFFLGPLWMLCHRGQQKLLQLHHFGDLPPVEHTAHQYQNGKRVPLERFRRAAPQPFQQLCWVKRGQQDPGIPFDDLQVTAQ